MTRQVHLPREKVALISDEDYERVTQHRWHVVYSGRGFRVVRRFPKSKWRQPLANFVLGVERGILVDHVDRDPFNNQRENLRVTTPALNAANQSKRRGVQASQYVGVSYMGNGRTKPWRATIRRNYKQLARYFATEDEAIAQRLAWEDQFDTQ
jgi:hypothetical protein